MSHEPITIAFKANSAASNAFLTPFRSPTSGGWHQAALPEGRLVIIGQWASDKRIVVNAVPQAGVPSQILWDSGLDDVSSMKTFLATGPGAILRVTGYGISQAEIDAGLYAHFLVVPVPFQE